MSKEIQSVMNSLKAEPVSKRANISILVVDEPSIQSEATNHGPTKCCREMHFYLEDNKLKFVMVLCAYGMPSFVSRAYFICLVDCLCGEERGISPLEDMRIRSRACVPRSERNQSMLTVRL